MSMDLCRSRGRVNGLAHRVRIVGWRAEGKQPDTLAENGHSMGLSSRTRRCSHSSFVVSTIKATCRTSGPTATDGHRSNHTKITELGSVQGVQQRLRVIQDGSQFFDATPFDAPLPRIRLRSGWWRLPGQYAGENRFDLVEVRRQPAFWLGGGDTLPDEAQASDTNGDTEFLGQFSLKGNWKAFARRLPAAG